jgi:hypothetical protein
VGDQVHVDAADYDDGLAGVCHARAFSGPGLKPG